MASSRELFGDPVPARAPNRWAGVAAVAGGWLAALVVVASVLVAEGGPDTASAALPAPAPEGSPPRGREISIAWAGDITPGSSYGVPPDGGRAQFEQARDSIRRADLAIGNLEGTFSTGGGSKCGGKDGGNCFSFQAPPRNAPALAWAGFDAMNLANNHSGDFGARGRSQTVAAVRGAGLAVTGRPGEITVLDTRRVRVALVGFAPNTGVADIRDIPGAQRTVRRAAKRADVVLVLMHAGAEGTDKTHVPRGREIAFGQDRGNTRAFTHAVVDAGADAVLGSGPHVLRGIELYRGKVIAYSLGNFAGWRNFAQGGTLSLTGLLQLNLSPEGSLRGGRFRSMKLTGPGVPAPDPTRASTKLVNRLGEEDFFGARLRLLPDGSF
ncbi:MAG: CapA family protein [Thermoleophilaceae bacterium]|nr:CapA family protein [Thermoleophilaceae bacterium]